MWSDMNWKVAPLMPPVDQILPSVDVNPAWLACLAGDGRFGGDAAHDPAGHPDTSRLSTSWVESKNPLPVASPPIAYSDPPEYANPKSALAGVNAGPVDQVPVVMSSRSVVALLASGADAPLEEDLSAIEPGTVPALAPEGVPENPPTTYRY